MLSGVEALGVRQFQILAEGHFRRVTAQRAFGEKCEKNQLSLMLDLVALINSKD